jgi:hypothetical protein
MTPAQLRAARHDLDLSTTDFAKLLRVSDGRVVRYWEDGTNGILGPVAIIIELIQKVPEPRRTLFGDAPPTPERPGRPRRAEAVATGRRKTTFRQVDGDPLPRYVHPIVDRYGVLRTYFRRGDEKGTIHGATLRAGGRLQLSARWWDEYNALKHRQPLPDADDDGDPEILAVLQAVRDAKI